MTKQAKKGSGAPPRSRAAALLLVVASLLFGAPAARANTYLFSFTTSQLMAALQTARSTAPNDDYTRSAYFGIFVQPDPAQVLSYSYGSLSSPNPTDANAWTAATISDPSSPYLGYGSQACSSNCTWASFYKPSDPAHKQFATVISAADNGPHGGNIFLGKDWYDQGDTPYAWGGQDFDTFQIYYDQVINAVMPGSDVFQFVINTNQTLAGTYRLKGYASALVSSSTSSFTLAKDDDGLPFSLNVTASAVPEPPAIALIIAGLALMLGSRRFKRPATAKPVATAATTHSID